MRWRRMTLEMASRANQEDCIWGSSGEVLQRWQRPFGSCLVNTRHVFQCNSGFRFRNLEISFLLLRVNRLILGSASSHFLNQGVISESTAACNRFLQEHFCERGTMKRVGAEHSDRHARQGLMKPPRKKGLSCSQDFSVDGDVPDPFTERNISLRSRLAAGKTKSHTKSKIIIEEWVTNRASMVR